MKVLVVDDSGLVRTVMRQMLTEMGHETFEAVNGKDALVKLNTHADIGLMMLDWNMPEMNGVELLDAIKSSPGSARRPIIIMVTTESQMERIVVALAKGANEYIMKPFTREILEEKLAILGIKSRSHV